MRTCEPASALPSALGELAFAGEAGEVTVRFGAVGAWASMVKACWLARAGYRWCPDRPASVAFAAEG